MIKIKLMENEENVDNFDIQLPDEILMNPNMIRSVQVLLFYDTKLN